MAIEPTEQDRTEYYQVEQADSWGRSPWDDPAIMCRSCGTTYLVSEGLVYQHNEWRIKCPYCSTYLVEEILCQ